MVCNKIILDEFKNFSERVLSEDIIRKLYEDLYLSFGLTQGQIYNPISSYDFINNSSNNKNNEKENSKMASEDSTVKYSISGFPVSLNYNLAPMGWSFSPTKQPEKIVKPIPAQLFYNEEKQITTILWEDGTKTMVKLLEGEKYAPDAALGYSYLKKVFGSRSAYMKFVNKTKIIGDKKKKKNIIKENPVEENIELLPQSTIDKLKQTLDENVKFAEVILDEVIEKLPSLKEIYGGNIPVKLPQCGDEDENGVCKLNWLANVTYIEKDVNDSGEPIVVIL